MHTKSINAIWYKYLLQFYRWHQFIFNRLVYCAKMKLFRSLLQYIEFMGIYSQQTHQPQTFNAKILFFTSSMALLFISLFAFFLFKATTIIDYGNSFYGFVSELNTLMDYLLIVWRMPIILHLIGNCEKFIEMSK